MKLVRTFAAILAVAGIAACSSSPTVPEAPVEAPDRPRFDLTVPADSLVSVLPDVPPIIIDIPPPDSLIIGSTHHGSGG